MRTRRHFLTATLVAGATLVLAGCSTLNAVTGLLGNQINFTQPQLQRYLNQSFPREFDKLGGLVSATLTNPPTMPTPQIAPHRTRYFSTWTPHARTAG